MLAQERVGRIQVPAFVPDRLIGMDVCLGPTRSAFIPNTSWAKRSMLYGIRPNNSDWPTTMKTSGSPTPPGRNSARDVATPGGRRPDARPRGVVAATRTLPSAGRSPIASAAVPGGRSATATSASSKSVTARNGPRSGGASRRRRRSALAHSRSSSIGRDRVLKAIRLAARHARSRARTRTAINGPSGCVIPTKNLRSEVFGSSRAARRRTDAPTPAHRAGSRRSNRRPESARRLALADEELVAEDEPQPQWRGDRRLGHRQPAAARDRLRSS